MCRAEASYPWKCPAFEARNVGPEPTIFVHFGAELARLILNTLNHIAAGGDVVPQNPPMNKASMTWRTT